MNTQKLWVGLGIITLLAVLTACQQVQPTAAVFECPDAIGCITVAPGDPIKIGVLQPLSGDAARSGTEQYLAFQVAANERNQQISGHPIALMPTDTMCLPAGGGNGALTLTSDPQLVAVLGTYCSAAAREAMPIIAEAGLVMVSGGNGAPSLTAEGGTFGADWHVGYFRTSPNGQFMGESVAHFIVNEQQLTRVATLNDGDAYTQGLTDVFNYHAEQLGGEAVLDLTINKEDTDLKPALEAVAQARPDALFAVVFRPAGDFLVAQISQVAGLDEVVLVLTENVLADELIQLYQADNVLFIAELNPPDNPNADQFVLDYEMLHQQSPTTIDTRPAYDAANILFNAIEAVAVRAADGTLNIGRQALRDALYTTRKHRGASGLITCDQFGDCAGIGYRIMRVSDPAAGVAGVRENVVYIYPPPEDDDNNR